ncbi:efflux transporter outer membrane subunit [Legionella longbeachae]|uniref:Putative outer membrane efflux protein n=1 Tax=Legionella longbeachae serogroup 1 (strain NSW150) TaxID=661367 RepID=D3HPQ8_LEGLN|nr:efflux transporter outer membrane subunit [Legionella longbeachae]VEE01394.1 outer membrane efflux protein [Legionella oakridgensis]HBD7396112.1 efflux transporter outer membrane subunit [Legionella pneumophila]ARB92240.1 transporter [Legionella longbeachae]ARM34579.1 efflux transporter outer membrane subunit [Legionella longbeachae]EEZ96131.1 putative outer membrane efflux protein [Legionella longbeachae D-4968]
MRITFIISLLTALTVTGCSLFGEIQTKTKPIKTDNLSVKHIYRIPKNKSRSYFKHFNDPQLDQLISIALNDAPNIHSAKARVDRSQQLAKIAYSTLWPAINLDGYLEKAYFPIRGTIPPDIRPLLTRVNQANIAEIGFQFNYELDFWGKNRENLASKISESFATRMDLAETRLVLSAAVATTYFEIQNSIIQQRLAQENVRLLKQLADIILDRAKQGIASNIPVKTALANYQTAILSVEDFKRAEMQSRHQLAVLMGKNPFTTQVDVAAFTYDKKQLVLPKIIPANILAQRPDIASARALTESAAHQINVAKTAFFPNINLRGLLSVQSVYFNKAFNIWFENDNASAAIDLPIFDLGARRANLGVSYTQFELAVNQYNQTILNSLQQVSDQLSTLKTLNTQIAAQNQAFNITESNYKLFQARYTQGIIDYPQLIEIKQLLIQQKATLQQLQTRQKQAFIALLTALGGEL